MNAVQPLLKILRSRKMAALLLLGFASGLPLFLTSRTLQAWMKDSQVDLGIIGWFSLIGLPYTLKFLWAPFLDRFVPPFLGRRRGWLLITQVGLLMAIATMSLQQPKEALQLLAINALVIAFLSATQDIASDAYRTDVLKPSELGLGASTWVLGYRVAILVSGSLALILADYISWQLVYLLLAGLMMIGILATLWAPEPSDRVSAPQTLQDAIYLPFKEFFSRSGVKAAILVLLFVLFFKLGDALVGNMAIPFLLDIGYSKTAIGALQGTFGFLATTLGVVGGGILLTRIGINRALWIFGGLQALSNLGYFSLTLLPQGTQWLLVAITLENFCAGLVTAAFVAYLMSQCNHAFTATQYALLSSLMASSNIILAAPAGDLAKVTGWSVFFLLTLLASLPGLLLLPFVAPWNAVMPTQIPMND
ncbi:AmpG family muropeptide MFS transporter [Leptolyngbyaceae cyanobacterium UHCC 1019]